MGKAKENILKAFNVEKEEAWLVLLLVLQSLFLGIFYGAFDTAANSLFLGVFPASDLPLAFTISGLAGIGLTAIYTHFQQRITFSRLAIYNIAAIAGIAFFMWYGFSVTSSKWLVFAVLVLMGPLNILAMIGFWGTAGRIFNLRQGKRLFGLVDTGLILGIIVSSYAIPVILSFNVKTKDILLISAISAFLAVVFQFIITYNTRQLSVKIQKNTKDEAGMNFMQMFQNKFIRLMAIFVAISMVVAFFISFSFLAVTKMNYPDEIGFAKFLGAFTGTVMIFTLLIKTFVYSKFVKTYGLKASLLISPVLLLVITVIASLIGSIGGYDITAGAFVFFFLFIAMGRLFSVSLKSSMEAPSFKILFQTIGPGIRHNVQARIDGTVNEISALSSGVILFLFGLISFFSLINFSHVLVFILVAWVWVAYKLYTEYRNNLDQSLSSIQSDNIVATSGNTGIAPSLLKGNEDAALVLFTMNMQEKLQPVVYEKLIPYLLIHRLEVVKDYAIARTASHSVYDALETFKNIDGFNDVPAYKSVAEKLSKELTDGAGNERILNLTRSKLTSDRELAARLVGVSGNAEMVHFLKFLLRDFDPRVKIAAIKAAARIQNPELATILTEFLATAQYGHFASDALIEIGQKSLESLEHLFAKSGHDSILLLRIVRIIGAIGGPAACESLVQKINYHDVDVARSSAKMLANLQYRVSNERYYLVHQAIIKYIHSAAWNITAKVSLREANNFGPLAIAINDELKLDIDLLFTLLSLVYDSNSVNHIRRNIEGEGTESVGYAIELLELIVSDELKPYLFPVIDDSTDNEKIKLLQEHFALAKVPLDMLCSDIINRDYNNTGIWAKACAFNEILIGRQYGAKLDIVANLFNPDEMLSELAAFIIFEADPNSLAGYFKRLPEKSRVRLRKAIEKYSQNPADTLFNKVLVLKNIEGLKNIDSGILVQLSKSGKYADFDAGEEIESLDEDLNILVYLITEGKVKIESGNLNETIAGPGTFFSGIFAPGYPAEYPVYLAEETCRVLTVKQEVFDRLVFDYPDFAKGLIKNELEKIG